MGTRTPATLAEGDELAWEHLITDSDVDGFAELSGDDNPLHMDDAFARRHGFRGRVVHGMLLGAFLSRVLGTGLPGPGVLWLSQDLRFGRAVYVGDRIQVHVRVKHQSPALGAVVIQTTVRNQAGEEVMSGEAKMMMLPTQRRPPWEEIVAVVTGGGRGIGAAIATELAERGARTVVNFRQDETAAGELSRRLTDGGAPSVAVRADAATADGARALAAAAQDAFGRIDVVVLNATPKIERRPLLEASAEELDGYWRAYVSGPHELVRAVAPGMRERGFGRIVGVLTSAILNTPPANMGAYVTAKSGAWGLLRSLAVEMAADGITVNAVSPSAVITDQWSDANDRQRRALAARIPLKRLPGPEEVAAAVGFLAGEGGDYLTGVNLPVAGGEVM
ncbi:MAG: SDR family oxidoreductase [Solirubrobacteraceae bacterium]